MNIFSSLSVIIKFVFAEQRATLPLDCCHFTYTQTQLHHDPFSRPTKRSAGMFTDSKYYPPRVCTNKINQIFGLLHLVEKLLTEPGLSCVRLHKINFSFIPMFCSFSKYKQTCFSGCNILEPCAKHHSCFFVVVVFFLP